MACMLTCNGGLPISLTTKTEGGGPPDLVDQPPSSAMLKSVPRTFILHVEFPHWLPVAVQGGSASN